MFIFIKSVSQIKLLISKIRDNELRKKQEIEFIEQFWVILTPEKCDHIKLETLSEFLKILLCPGSTTVSEILSVLKR